MIDPTSLRTPLAVLLSSAAALTLAACGGDDGDDTITTPTVALSEGALVTSNPAGRSGDRILRASARLDNSDTAFTDIGAFVSAQSLALDAAGHGYLTFDRFDSTGGFMVYADLADLADDASLGAGARVVAGASTNLVAPKGLFVADDLGLVIVADFGAEDIKAFAIDAEGDVAARHTLDIGDGRSVWDVHYDATTDVLWASGTDGVALAYDDFSVDFGDGGPDRTLTPTGLGQAQVSVNLHGVAYDDALDLLILSDVGDAGDATDGQLFVIASASTADGDTQVAARVRGGATGLGNPVDIYLEGANLFVAEKSNDVVLRFDGALALVGDLDLAADGRLSVMKSESVVVSARGGIGGGAILTVSNPVGVDDDAIVQAPFTLASDAAVFTELGTVTSVESVALSSGGDASVSFDSGGLGGVLISEDLAGDDDGGMLGDGDRMILGAATTLVSPKGLTVRNTMLIVADFGARAIKIFSANASGDVAPDNIIDDLGGDRSVWDVYYEADADLLFATGTDGALLVYDDFSSDRGASGPTRVIVPDGSVNLHGVAYDAGADLAFVTDVGDPGDATDGQIFVIEGASEADGSVTPRVTVGGASTMLGNPVDCAYDGLRLYVAEKSNDAVLRFDRLASLSASVDRAPDSMTVVAKAESIALIR